MSSSFKNVQKSREKEEEEKKTKFYQSRCGIDFLWAGSAQQQRPASSTYLQEEYDQAKTDTITIAASSSVGSYWRNFFCYCCCCCCCDGAKHNWNSSIFFGSDLSAVVQEENKISRPKKFACSAWLKVSATIRIKLENPFLCCMPVVSKMIVGSWNIAYVGSAIFLVLLKLFDCSWKKQ